MDLEKCKKQIDDYFANVSDEDFIKAIEVAAGGSSANNELCPECDSPNFDEYGCFDFHRHVNAVIGKQRAELAVLNEIIENAVQIRIKGRYYLAKHTNGSWYVHPVGNASLFLSPACRSAVEAYGYLKKLEEK